MVFTGGGIPLLAARVPCRFVLLHRWRVVGDDVSTCLNKGWCGATGATRGLAVASSPSARTSARHDVSVHIYVVSRRSSTRQGSQGCQAPAAPAAPKFSDKNASWLKSVDAESLFGDEEDGGGEYDDEEEGEEYEDDEDDEGETVRRMTTTMTGGRRRSRRR